MASPSSGAGGHIAELVSALIEGRPSPTVQLYLDALLQWLAAPDAQKSASIRRELRARDLDPGRARRLALQLLDEMLFVGPKRGDERVLGLSSAAPLTRIRARYHLLMRVYHPDLAEGNSPWLHQRAERINRAYGVARDRAERRGRDWPVSPPRSAPRRRSRRAPRSRRTGARSLRRLLGGAPVVRRRAVVGLLLACAALVAHTCVSNQAWQRWTTDSPASISLEAGATLLVSRVGSP